MTITPTETLIRYIQQKQLVAGKAYDGSLVHLWHDHHKTYCGKSHLVRRSDRLFDWRTSRVCKSCLAEVEKIMFRDGWSET